jgi:SIR2-like domain
MEFREWDKLVYGIERGECTLFLGPQLPLDRGDGKRRIPVEDLAARLLEQLDEQGGARAGVELSDLARISQRFLAQEAEVDLEMEINRWHQGLTEQQSTLHDHLAALPFRLILTSTLDPLMEMALRRAGKRPWVERYHYRGKNKQLLPEATDKTPLLFQLYGCVSEPTSVVITETQLLDFLAALISKDPPLPNDLNAALTNGKLFLFLGFGLHQWYLRILLHVLKVLRRGSRSFVSNWAKAASTPPRRMRFCFTARTSK